MNKVFLTVIIAVFLCGCASSNYFTNNGLPRDHFYVGGGFKLAYKAPSRGNLYLLAANADKLILTESLEEEEWFNWEFDPRDEDMHMQIKSFGIDPLNATFKMYFIPS